MKRRIRTLYEKVGFVYQGKGLMRYEGPKSKKTEFLQRQLYNFDITYENLCGIALAADIRYLDLSYGNRRTCLQDLETLIYQGEHEDRVTKL